MSALVTADLHLADNTRDSYRHAFMEKLPSLVEKMGVDKVIILGDLTEEKDRHSAWLVNRVVDYIYALAEVCFVDIAMGNHDYISIDDPFFQFLGRLQRVKFITNPTAYMIDGLGHCLFLPHARDYKVSWALSSIKKKNYSYIFAHQTFSGADVGHGRKLDGVPLDVFPKDARVISGDVHVPQCLGPVTYVGAPYTIDFGDEYAPRMLQINEAGMKSISCKGAQKKLIEVDSVEKLKTISTIEGDIVKVRVHVKQAQHADWPEMQEKVRLWGRDRCLIVHAVLPIIEAGTTRRVESSINDPKSDRQVVTQFAQAREVDAKTLGTGLWLMDQGAKS